MWDTLVVNEIFLSLQGESTFAGVPCIFVRLTACNLRCSYCDTAYAFAEGRKMSLSEIRDEVQRLAARFDEGRARCPQRAENAPALILQRRAGDSPPYPIVELTGGEPLLQPNSLPLMKSFCEDGFTVLVETSGAHDISSIDHRVHRIMDLKCPSSGEVERNYWPNVTHLRSRDEVKFVIGTVEDFEWAKQKLVEHNLAAICPVLFSWVEPLLASQRHPALKKVPPGQTPISRRELAERVLAEGLPVRFQVQMHKVIWPKEARGV